MASPKELAPSGGAVHGEAGHGTGATPVLLDLAAATASAALVTGLLVARGGIWEHVSSGDLHANIMPLYDYTVRAVVHEGRLPLWAPDQLCGAPVFGLGFTGALYPPVLLLVTALSPWAALQGLYGVHVFLMTWGFCAYLRRYGVPRPAAVLAAWLTVAGVFRGPLLSGVDHPQFLYSAAWVPIVLLAWERAIETRRARWVGWLALAVAGQWLSGYPDPPLHFPVLLGVMALARDEGTVSTRAGTLLAGLALGGALAAVQVLPLAEAAAESPRAAEFPADTYRRLFAVHSPGGLVESFMDRFGPAAVALVLAGLWPVRRVRLAWFLALVWATFALNAPFRLLYLLPTHAGIRFPFGWSLIAGALVGILAAVGLAALRQHANRWSRTAALLLGIAAAGHALLVIARAPTSLPAFHPGAAKYRAPDLDLVARRAHELARYLGDGTRLLSAREQTAGAALRHGLPIVNGQETALPPRRVVALLQEVKLFDALGLYRPRHWTELAARPDIGALMGIGVVVVPPAAAAPFVRAGFERVGTLPPDDVVLRRTPVPRARLVHAALAAAGEEGTLAATVAHAHEALRLAVVEEGALAAPLEDPPAHGHEQTRIVEDGPERVVVEASVAARALLVLRDTYYPGWRATVNDVPVPIVRTDHAFRGVVLDPGAHRVEFRYAPGSLRLGQAITAVALLVTLGCIALPARAHGR
jgi:hypothetical protein